MNDRELHLEVREVLRAISHYKDNLNLEPGDERLFRMNTVEGLLMRAERVLRALLQAREVRVGD